MTNVDRTTGLPPAVEAALVGMRDDAGLAVRAADLLLRLMRIDTTPKPSPEDCARAEAEVFGILEAALADRVPGVRVMRVPVRLDIDRHPYFTIPYYAAVPRDPRDRLVARVYEGRANLLAQWGRPGLPRIVFNAHVDTVAPFLPVRQEGGTLYGRGAVDDKGPCVAIVLALEVLAAIERTCGYSPVRPLLVQFVIDEESGGNGSLSAALDTRDVPTDAIIVLECTGLAVHPANRGVVWHETTLSWRAAPQAAARAPEAAAPPGPGSVESRWAPAHSLDTTPACFLVEAMAFVIGALDEAGRRLRAESDHPLFPHRPVQTCHGRLGGFGRHPSRVQDYVALRLRWGDASPTGPAAPGGASLSLSELARVVDEGLAEYCAAYGDKTKPGVGDAVLERHLRWAEVAPGAATMEVFGLAGHMGAVDRLDGAITKAATIVRRLVRTRARVRGPWSSLTIGLADACPDSDLSLEGGQGFLPSHELEEVCDRMREAVRRGIREYLELASLPADAIEGRIAFDKLHNAAYTRPADGPAMRAMLGAAAAAGIYKGEPVRGWDVSCDARIFAREFPRAEVITFGPGALAQAHGNDEHVAIREVIAAAEALARFAMGFRG